MKSNIKYLGLSLIMLCASLNLFSWGAKGHDVVAYVAEQHLTKSAKAKISKVLSGRSLVYYANWADNASHTPEYAYTKTWHYMNIDEGYTVESMKRNPKGDVETAINLLVGQLMSDTLTVEEEAVALKFLIHFVGDIHCPMHLGRLSDRGGNMVEVLFFNSKSSLHRLWDSQLLEAGHKWSYSEWAQQIDIINKKEAKAIQMSKPLDWARESYEVAKDVYEELPAGSKVSYNEIHKYAPVIEGRLLRGGYRLAALLNEIYR